MWITQVELHHIKSYGKRTVIDLAQGVNAICGKNGAGKSTILEAIGLALFGKSAYKNQEQFIHEKAKKGQITITLFDSRDERLYQVIRPLKGGPPYVYDPETHRELASGVEDVQQWLRDCIRVEPTTDLKALFENAIGVAQGLLTVSFLETEANRRKVFDPLLNVEDYKQAYDKLRAVNTQVKEWQNENTAQQARLEGQLEALPGHQAEAQALGEKMQTTEGQLAEVSLQLAGLIERLAALEKQKAALDGLTRQAETLAGQLAAGQTQFQAAQAELDRAAQAKATVEHCEADYRLYEQAQKEREGLEDNRKIRDKVRERLVKSEGQLSKLEQDANHLQQQLQNVAQAEARLVELKPQVEKQETLEGELQQAQAAVEALKTVKQRLAGEEQRQAKLEQTLAQLHIEVQQRQSLAQEIEQLEQQRHGQLEEWDRLNAELTTLEQQRSSVHQALQIAQAQVSDYRNLQGRLQEANEALPQRQEKLRQIKAEVVQRQDLERQQEALNERRQQRQAELMSLELQLSAEEARDRQVRQALNDWQNKVGALENHQTNLAALETRLAKAQADLLKLEAGVAQRQQTLAGIAALEAEGLETGLQRDKLKDSASHDKARLTQIKEAVTALAVEADSPCPVCRKPLSEHDIGSLQAHYQAETETLTTHLAEAESSLLELDNALKRGQRQLKKLQTELETLPNPFQLEKQQELVASYGAEATALQAEITPLGEAPTQVARLQEEIGRIEAALSHLKESGAALRQADKAGEQQQQRLQSQISQLARPAEVEPLEAALKALQTDLERWAAEAEPLAGTPQQLADLQAQDSALSAQRTAHQQRLHTLNGEREALAQQIQQRQSQMNNLAAPARIDALQLELEAQKDVVTDCLAVVAGLAPAPETLTAVEAALHDLGNPRRAYGVAEAEAAKRPTLEADLVRLQSQLQEAQQTKLGIEGELLPFANLDRDLEGMNATLSRTRNGHETYLEHRAVAESLPHREARAAEIRQSVAGLAQQNEEMAQALAAAQAAYDPVEHEARGVEREETRGSRTRLETQLAGYRELLPQAQAKVEALAAVAAELAEQKRAGERLDHLQEVIDFIRRTIRDAGPEITRRLVRAVSLRADQIFADIINDYQQELIWDENYGITLRRGDYERDFQQLSGGEAMAAALAVRLALLQSMSAVDVAFFDEPTANLDPERRANLAEQIARIKGFSQLVVISHDDTFEQDTGHVIHITKDEQGYSQVT